MSDVPRRTTSGPARRSPEAGRPVRAAAARAAISRRHRAAYLRLADTIEQVGRTPCQLATDDWWWSDVPASQEAAVAACRRCPARQPCQAYAAAVGEEWGVWGATTPADRRREARANRTAGHRR